MTPNPRLHINKHKQRVTRFQVTDVSTAYAFQSPSVTLEKGAYRMRAPPSTRPDVEETLVLEQQPTPFDGDLDPPLIQPDVLSLRVPLNGFLILVLDAMVQARAREVVVTDGSTFGAFVKDVLWRRHWDD
ncbi:hypothetical protein EDB19DRAFT_1832105 [Suillus lakei]|nr:hypothetical protein EDB19DRAFT_1832105 [Suillus lakei]